MSRPVYHLDWETYSAADIRDVGAYRYAEDPSTEIILGGVARGEEKPRIWDYSTPDVNMGAEIILEEMSSDPGVIIYAHNSQFEWAICKYLWEKTFGFKCPKIEQFRCTAAMARRSALPSSLEKLGEFLRLEIQKDPRGKKLIQLFCVPVSAGKLKGTRVHATDDRMVTVLGKKMHVRDAWKDFRSYNYTDVIAERQAHGKLKAFEFEDVVLESFLMDARMNDRGIPVNRDALMKADTLIRLYQEKKFSEFQALTGLNPTQRDAVLNWLTERGYGGGCLTEEVMSDWREDPREMTEDAQRALDIRGQISFAAVKKVTSMLDCACTDGRVRGSLKWAGAIRTHRWAGLLIQPQNFRRPTIKQTAEAYQAIIDGKNAKYLEIMWGHPLEVIASCIRHFMQDQEYDFLDSDYANIEARITPWLAGQKSLIEDFKLLDRLKQENAPPELIKQADPYVKMAAVIFDKPAADIVDDERFVGKQAILGAGFQVGWEKFQTMCAGYGRELDDDLCKATIKAYRETNTEVKSMWDAMQQAAIKAIEEPGTSVLVRGKIRFRMAKSLPYSALVMQLPSGHCLIYPQPEVRPIWMFRKQRYGSRSAAQFEYDIAKRNEELEEGERVWETKEISFYGKPDPTKEIWGRCTTYGGKLLENAVQATAGDFITEGVLTAEKDGYNPFLLVHDETLALNDHARPHHSPEHFKGLLCRLPDWAPDFPLDASIKVTPYYAK